MLLSCGLALPTVRADPDIDAVLHLFCKNGDFTTKKQKTEKLFLRGRIRSVKSLKFLLVMRIMTVKKKSFDMIIDDVSGFLDSTCF